MLIKITDSLKSSASKAVPLSKFKPHLKPYWKDGLGSLHQLSRVQRKIWIENATRASHKVMHLAQGSSSYVLTRLRGS